MGQCAAMTPELRSGIVTEVIDEVISDYGDKPRVRQDARPKQDRVRFTTGGVPTASVPHSPDSHSVS